MKTSSLLSAAVALTVTSFSLPAMAQSNNTAGGGRPFVPTIGVNPSAGDVAAPPPSTATGASEGATSSSTVSVDANGRIIGNAANPRQLRPTSEVLRENAAQATQRLDRTSRTDAPANTNTNTNTNDNAGAPSMNGRPAAMNPRPSPGDGNRGADATSDGNSKNVPINPPSTSQETSSSGASATNGATNAAGTNNGAAEGRASGNNSTGGNSSSGNSTSGATSTGNSSGGSSSGGGGR